MHEPTALRSLRVLKAFLNMNNIRCWIDQGTLLGAVRNGKFISHDLDIDFGILFKDTRLLLSRVAELKAKGFILWIHANNVTLIRGIPITFACYQPIANDFYLHIDYPSTTTTQFAFQICQDVAGHKEWLSREASPIGESRPTRIAYRLSKFKSMRPVVRKLSVRFWRFFGGKHFGYLTPRRFYDSLEPVMLYDMEFNAPHPVEEYLAFKYGYDWRVLNRNWNAWWDDGAIVHSWDIEAKVPTWRTLADLQEGLCEE